MQPNGAEAGPADRGEQGQRLLSNYDAGGSTADAWGIAQLSEGAADTSTTAAAAPPPPAPPPARWRAPLAAFWNNGVAVAVVSSLSFATAAALVKSPLIQGRIPVFEIVVVRAIVSAAMTSLSCYANDLPYFGRTAPKLLLLARGVIGATAMTASYEALVRLPLADSTVIFYCSPALTALLAWLLLGEAFGPLTALGCATSLAGVVLVAQPPWLAGSAAVEWSGERLWGTIFGFAGAALAAGGYICIRLIGKREHPLSVAMWFHSAAFVSSVIPLSAGYPEPAVPLTPAQFGVLLGIACGSFGGSLLVNRAFQLELAAKASAVNFTQVIFAYLYGLLLFHDKPSLLGLAGTALIASGVIVVNAEKLLRHYQQQQQQGNGVAAAAAAAAAPSRGGPRWWQRLRAALPGGGGGECPPIKAKRSDLEAEMGRLPGFSYARIAGGEDGGGGAGSRGGA